MSINWSHALETLIDYQNSSYSLPPDHSLISPIARVILQKRRLLKIQEIHNLLLKVSHEPTETLLQSENENEFLINFKPTFLKLPWNELSVCEADCFASLLVDTMTRCQADSQYINFYIKLGVAEIQGPDFGERMVALRSALLLIRAIFVAFPKAACTWANDVLKLIISNFKSPHANASHFDIIHESLRCLQVLLRIPGKYVETKEREKVLGAVTKYLKASSAFIVIQAAKVLDAYYETIDLITKPDIKIILELLNGSLSTRINEFKSSSKLLEFCFELKSSEIADIDLVSLKLNIERIRKYPKIDEELFADAFSNVLCRWKDRDIEPRIQGLLLFLLPSNSKTTSVSAGCFSKIVEFYVERCQNHNEAVKTIRFIFEHILLGVHTDLNFDYYSKILALLANLYEKFPDSLKEADFSSFIPLTALSLQIKSIDLIEKVLKDHPMTLASQITLNFAQLKGDFLRIKLSETNVNKEAVIGLLRLFARLLKVSVENYSNYCDRDFVEKIINWLYLQLAEESEWLINEPEIIKGLLEISAFLCPAPVNLITIVVGKYEVYSEIILKFLLKCIENDGGIYNLFHGSIEKCFHDIHDKSAFITLEEMFPVMKIAVESKKEIEFPVVSFLARLISFEKANTSGRKFTQILELFSRIFWKSSASTRDFCMTMFTNNINKNSGQILQTLRFILESSEVVKGEISLMEKIQEIVKKFVIDEKFEVRLECGIILGLMVNLFKEKDSEGINELYQQCMKHSMRPLKDCKSRVCYIMGLTTLKTQLDIDNIKGINLSFSALIGLLASWNREKDFETKLNGQEINSVSIFALSYYLEKCGCLVNSEFYRDTCELLLEQVFLRQRCELTMKSVLELTKCLALYANLMPSQSEFIRKTVRVLAESSYLNNYRNYNIKLLVEISECNPMIVSPSELIYKLIKKNIAVCRKGAFEGICQYFNLQVSSDSRIGFELIDCGLFLSLLRRSNTSGVECELVALSFLIQKVMSVTLIDRFEFWLEYVFENLNLTERNVGIKAINNSVKSPKISLSDSAFSLTDLADGLKDDNVNIGSRTACMIITSLSSVMDSRLFSIDIGVIKRFLNCLIKICFNVSTEKSQERKFYLSGISLFRGIVKTFSKMMDRNNLSILEPFDSQIISIISSILRASEEGDPLFAACSFGSLFSLCSNRPDLQVDLTQGTGRIYNIIKKSVLIIKEQEIYWREEVVENLIVLSILVGLSSLIKIECSPKDLFDEDMREILVKRIEECCDAYKEGMLEKNIRASLSGSDRLLLVETLIKLNKESRSSEDVFIIDGVFSVLNGINSENMESVCLLLIEIFKEINFEINNKDTIDRTLSQVLQFGLEKRDPLAFDCLMELKMKNLSADKLRKLSREFLSMRFSDFDTQFGLKAVKAQEILVNENDDEDQSLLFDILKKLISSCLNDLEVNNPKEILKLLKTIFSNPKISIILSNSLILEWIGLLEEIDSTFLNQLVFFSVSSNSQIWEDEVLRRLRKHCMKLLSSVNTLEMALDSWILLLKSQSKRYEVIKSESESKNDNEKDVIIENEFDNLVNSFTDQVEGSFQKHRGASIDPIWERIFSIALVICDSSEANISAMKRVKEFAIKSLEDLNDFK